MCNHLFVFLLFLLLLLLSNQKKQSCRVKGLKGICLPLKSCSNIQRLLKKTEYLQQPRYRVLEIFNCNSNYTDNEAFNKVCCLPNENFKKIFRQIKYYYKLLPKTCGQVRKESYGLRIASGKPVRPSEHPWMVQIWSSKQHACSGTIISSKFLLTAAHCVQSNAESNELEFRINGNVQKFESIRTHKGYNSRTHENDIALVKVKSIQFNNLIQPICLPFYSQETYLQNEKLSVIGWETTKNNILKLEKLLKSAEQTLISNLLCKKKLQDTSAGYFNLTDNQMCCKWKTGRPCRGDSGGPLTQLRSFDQNHQYVLQQGINSVGHTKYCDEPSYKITPINIYTKVKPYMKWIIKSMNDLFKKQINIQ